MSSTPVESAIFAAEHRLAAVADHRAGQGGGPLLPAGHRVGPEVLHGLPHFVDVASARAIGLPNQIDTRRGCAVGHFQKNLPPRKLKMLPHSSSR